jgi:hypothetical protein
MAKAETKPEAKTAPKQEPKAEKPEPTFEEKVDAALEARAKAIAAGEPKERKAAKAVVEKLRKQDFVLVDARERARKAAKA